MSLLQILFLNKFYFLYRYKNTVQQTRSFIRYLAIFLSPSCNFLSPNSKADKVLQFFQFQKIVENSQFVFFLNQFLMFFAQIFFLFLFVTLRVILFF